MGELMFCRLSALILAILICLSELGPAWAQSDSQLDEARESLDVVMGVVVQSVLAAMNCTHSDEKAWYLVLASIDRRQDACVRQNVNWEKLSDGSPC